MIKSRIALHLGRSMAMALEDEVQGSTTAPINYERIVIESLAMRSLAVPASERLVAYLADGAAINAAVDGSVTPANYVYAVPAGYRVAIAGISILLADTGLDADLWGTFGGLSPLSNGIGLVADTGGASPAEIVDLTAGNPWRRTADVVEASGRWDLASGSGVDVLTAHLAIPGGLLLTAGQRLVMTVGDNLIGLDALRCRLHGVIRTADSV